MVKVVGDSIHSTIEWYESVMTDGIVNWAAGLGRITIASTTSTFDGL